MRVAIFTSTSLRHTYFASRIAQVHEVVRVFAETKAYNPQTAYHTPEEKKTMESWFNMRTEAEEEFFGGGARAFVEKAANSFRHLPAGEINSAGCMAHLRYLSPDAVAVFGSSLLREPLLETVRGRVLNMHLGLSPYYRGSGTNFWPFYNEEPEYVGATIHWIDLGIDTGPIIHQGRPQIERGDNPHSIGCKAIIVGTELMIQSLREIEQGTVQSHLQKEGVGRLYRRKDFGPKHVADVFQKLEQGLVQSYTKDPVEVELVP